MTPSEAALTIYAVMVTGLLIGLLINARLIAWFAASWGLCFDYCPAFAARILSLLDRKHEIKSLCRRRSQ
jgi:hypothetical protein